MLVGAFRVLATLALISSVPVWAATTHGHSAGSSSLSTHVSPTTSHASTSPSQLSSVSLDKLHNSDNASKLSFKDLYESQIKFLDAFIYPGNVAQAKAINSTIFSDDVQGRVDITRTFVGRELNTEYIFGLFANLALNPYAFTLLGYATSYDIVHFAASQNIAVASVRFNFSFPLLGGRGVPLVIDTWNAFNEQGQISQYDATFKWWQWAVDYLLGSAATELKMNVTEVRQFAAQQLTKSICNTAMSFCNGTNTQYNSTQQCQQYLSQHVRLGEAYELGRNTLLCRMVHQNMVPLRPAVHCPHIGPTGGGYCNDDETYLSTVNASFFSNLPFAYSDKGALTES